MNYWKNCNLNEKERMARQNHPLTVCSSATISQEPLMEAFGRPGVVIRTFLEYLKIKNRGILQSGSQKIVHKPRNPCRVKTAQKEFRGSDFALFICVSCYCSFILQQALLVLCSKNQILLLNESNLLRYTVNHFDKVFLTKHFNQIGNLLSLLLLVMIKYCCFHPLAIN